MIDNPRVAVFFHGIYSWLSNLVWFSLGFAPGIFRYWFFKVIFKRFGYNCVIDYRCYIRYPWRVSIGSCVAINRGCEFYPSMQTREGVILLEDHVVLGPRVVIFTAGHDYSFIDLPDISAPVVIKRNAWVGGNTTILPGVTIGEGAVVGAGSVVSRDIPAYSVAVGNPAKVIKRRHMKDALTTEAVNES